MRDVNPKTIDLIKSFEGLRLIAYDDAQPEHKLKLGEKPKGNLTIGYGHTKGVYIGQTCTEERAEKWLREDLANSIKDVLNLVEVPLTDNEFGAVVSGQFNAGWLTYKDQPSTLRKKLNAGNKIGAANEMRKWVNFMGKELPGLVRRREAERALFMSA